MTRTTMTSRPVCAGCGKAIPLNHLGHPVTYEVQVDPQHRVHLCPGRARVPTHLTNTYLSAHVSAACLRKALDRLACCPACGGPLHRGARLCLDCRAAIARGTEISEARGGLHWTALDLGSFLPYLSDIREDPDRLRERVARLLMQACASGRHLDRVPDEPYSWIGSSGSGGWIGCPAAEMTTNQRDALQALLNLLDPLCRLYLDRGKQEGSNILRALMAGTLSVSDLDERAQQDADARAKLHARLDAKLDAKPDAKGRRR